MCDIPSLFKFLLAAHTIANVFLAWLLWSATEHHPDAANG